MKQESLLCGGTQEQAKIGRKATSIPVKKAKARLLRRARVFPVLHELLGIDLRRFISGDQIRRSEIRAGQGIFR